MDNGTGVFTQQRPRLFGLAYRLLGSASDAEDILQEAFLRWDAGAVASAGTAPAVTAADGLGPLETVAQRESVSMALLLLCEQLTAPERAVFILHEAFGYRYGEIADIIGRSEATCRQLGHRAAARLKAESRSARFTPRDPAEAARWRQLTGQFIAAAAAGDLPGLEHLLADDVVSWSDGGGKVPAGLRPVLGREKVARLYAALGPALVPGGELTPALAHALGDILRGGLEVTEAEVNGSPAIMMWAGGRLFGVFVPVIEGDKITALYAIAAPDKLSVAGRQAHVSRNAEPSSQ
jgi:RNA polymerase sigma-70 factor (ECF subfamily)